MNAIELDTTPIRPHVMGNRLGQVWWRGSRWAVTEDGIERLDGLYIIEAARLREQENRGWSWPQQIAAKGMGDIEEFATAWLVALVLHGKAKPEDAPAIREIIDRLPL
jgi:hypothetical protein